MFEHHLLVNLADSELFKPLVDYLVVHQKETDFLDPSVVINELLQDKRTNEAAVVDRACRGQQGRSYIMVDICLYYCYFFVHYWV